MKRSKNKNPRGRGRALLILLAGLTAGLAPGCAGLRTERCYVEDDQYSIAYNMFVESGSLDLVEQQLSDFQWRRCVINEVIYRLTHEFEVISDQDPSLSSESR